MAHLPFCACFAAFFSRGLNHPETCAGAFIRSALVLFALLPLLEPGASLTSAEGKLKTVSSVSERSQPSCLAASHSTREVGFPFIIQAYVAVVVCVCGEVCSIERRLDFFVKALAQEDLAILVSWCGSAAAAARILRAGPHNPKRQASEPFADGPRRGDDIPQIGMIGVYGLEHKGVEW